MNPSEHAAAQPVPDPGAARAADPADAAGATGVTGVGQAPDGVHAMPAADVTNAPRAPAARTLAQHDEPEFRIVAGANAGARWVFGPGSCLIGASRGCDVVLAGRGIAAEALLVTFVDAGLAVRSLVTSRHAAAAVRLGGRALRPGRTVVLREGQSLAIGDARLVFGDARSDWDRLLQLARRTPVADDAAPAPSRGLRQRLQRARAALALRRSAVAGRRGRIPVVSTALAAVLSLVLLGVAFGALVHRNPDPSSFTSERLADHVRDLVEQRHLDEVRVVPRGQGVSVQGYVPDQSALTRLRDALHGTRAVVSVYGVDELRRYIQERMRSAGQSADVQYDGNGTFTVTGTAADGAGFRAAAERIRPEIPGLRALRAMPTETAKDAVAVVPRPDEPLVLGGVNGINTSGQSRYITSGSNYIFSGGVLQNGMTVVEIEPGRVVVDDKSHGRRTEVGIR